jgi:hypothetical protein
MFVYCQEDIAMKIVRPIYPVHPLHLVVNSSKDFSPGKHIAAGLRHLLTHSSKYISPGVNITAKMYILQKYAQKKYCSKNW